MLARGDHCAAFGCSNDRRYPEKQLVLPHVGVLRFYSPISKKDGGKWEKLLNRRDVKVTLSTKVCSNHFIAGYRSKECPNRTIYVKGYDIEKKKTEAFPKKRRRKNEILQDSQCSYGDDDVDGIDSHCIEEPKERDVASVISSLNTVNNSSSCPGPRSDGGISHATLKDECHLAKKGL